MRVLVTGGAGFVAGHLRNELAAAGYEVFLTDVLDSGLPDYFKVDLTNEDAVHDLVATVRPESIVHLGAISFVPDAAKDRKLLERVNVGGTHNLLKAIAAAELPRRPNDLPQFLFVSTAQVYNKNPSAYALSKMSAEATVLHYCHEGIDAVIARPANHTGPGQSEKFVVPSFVRQAIDIKNGRLDHFRVGNLDSVRDFTDVRDVVRAYRLLLEKGETTGVYAICSPVRMTMRELLFKVSEIVGVPNRYEVVEELWRPTDVALVLDTTHIEELGWSPAIPVEKTIRDIIESECGVMHDK